MTTIAPAEQEETEDTGETTVVESNLPRLENSVCLTSMFDREAAVAAAETAVNDPDYVCVAAHLWQSVGDHTSLMSPCINCNQIAHYFCAEYLSEQNPVEEYLVITIEDLSKEGKLRFKQTPSAQKCDIMFCILCESDDDEVLGATTAEGMPLVGEETTEKLPLKPGSPWQGEAGENIDIDAGSPGDWRHRRRSRRC